METKSTPALTNLKPEAAKNGIGLGLIATVLGVISAYLMVRAGSMWMVFLVPAIVSFIIPVVISVFFSLDLRKKIGGYWDFRHATSGIFIMFLVSFAISTAGNLVFTKLIEPEMPQMIQNSVLDATTSMMEKQGLDRGEINKKVDTMKVDFEKKNQGTVMQTIQGYLMGIIIIFVVSLLFGAIFKKQAPLSFVDHQEE